MVFEESRKLSQLYRRLETSGKPWVAAVNGTAMGGGFELMLACHHRVVSDNPKTRLGLPEVKVGLFPGAGGTQRVARMIPPSDALQFLLKGEQLKVDRAKAMKLIDEVVPEADLIKTAKEWIKAGNKGVAPWDVKGFRLPGGPGLVESRHDDLHAGQRHLPARNLRQLSRRPRHSADGLRRPAGGHGHRLAHRIALVRKCAALAAGGGHDPHAVRLHAGIEQGRAPAAGRAAVDA